MATVNAAQRVIEEPFDWWVNGKDDDMEFIVVKGLDDTVYRFYRFRNREQPYRQPHSTPPPSYYSPHSQYAAQQQAVQPEERRSGKAAMTALKVLAAIGYAAAMLMLSIFNGLLELRQQNIERRKHDLTYCEKCKRALSRRTDRYCDSCGQLILTK